MTDEEKEFAVNLCNQANWDVDLVLSHTCPSLFTPTDLFLTFIDQSTVDKSTEQFLGELEFKLKYHLWLFGHFHADRLERPHVEQYFNNIEELSTIWSRWDKYDKTGES